ncbi:6-carboxytetrahydropterin synthase [Paraflavisolibacter sp. H34]|uniref:6-pyruvoyl trahydropterin synthase family protein n=1 Tax=Huijunlia imazamoxiresistens TaxID=3127457 RepID=UPI003018D1D0
MNRRVAVYRREHFNAAHRLYNAGWSDEQNYNVFGKCSLPHFHGHNYELEVKVVGLPDPATGFVMDMKRLSDLINETVIYKFDHKNLNLDTEEFKSLNPTAENIVVVIFNLLRPHIDPALDLVVRLYETPRNFVEYPAS